MSFRLATVIYKGQRIPLIMDNLDCQSNRDNYYTILIGRNGTGKSRLLAEICRAFESFDNDGNLRGKKRRPGKIINTIDQCINHGMKLYCVKNNKNVEFIFSEKK